jgi:hypothetical protein
MSEDYSYWEIHYKSCEGNDRWTIARTPPNWNEYDVKDRISMGGCGDDPSEIREVFETNDSNYTLDFYE